jgi:P pilus assembly chaperone PapD
MTAHSVYTLLKETRRRVVRVPLTVIVAAFLSGFGAAQAQPKLMIQKTEFELGTIYNGDIVRTPITITNTGNEPLHIESVRTSCGCTTVKEPKKTLKPGESETFEVQFNSSGFRGRYAKYVYVQTDDPSADYHTITLRADIKEELVPVPPVSVAWLGNIPVGKTHIHTMRFTNQSDKAITLKKVTGLPASVTAATEPKTVAPSDTVVVRLAVKPAEEGYSNTEVTIETNSPNQPHVPFRITYIGVKPE